MDKCPKCGYEFSSVKLTAHKKKCRGRGPRGPLVWPNIRFNTAQLEASRIAEYYDEGWRRSEQDLDAVVQKHKAQAASVARKNPDRNDKAARV
jgi:hypothetical protein